MTLADTIRSRIQHEAPRSEFYLPPQPEDHLSWWRNLNPDFAQHKETFNLNLRDRMFVSATSAIDAVLRTSAASMVSAVALPQGFSPAKIKRDQRRMTVYEACLNQNAPEAFFATPPRRVNVEQMPPNGMHFKPEAGECVDLTFISPFQTVHPDMRKEYAGERANRQAHARYWRHFGGPRPTIFVIHGFGAEQYLLNEYFFHLKWFYETLGCDIVLYTLPFHGPRSLKNSVFSGQGYFSKGLAWLNEAVAQAVHDFRIFLNYILDDVGAPSAGVTGVSLGGYHSAVLATVEERLSFAIPNVPVVSLADIFMEWEPAGYIVRKLLKTADMDIPALRRNMAVHSPLSYKPKLAPEQLFVIGGIGDLLAPPKHSRLLWEHWGQCSIHWFPGSHILHLDRNEYLREVARFLRELDFLPEKTR